MLTKKTPNIYTNKQIPTNTIIFLFKQYKEWVDERNCALTKPPLVWIKCIPENAMRCKCVAMIEFHFSIEGCCIDRPQVTQLRCDNLIDYFPFKIINHIKCIKNKVWLSFLLHCDFCPLFACYTHVATFKNNTPPYERKESG